MGKPSQSMAHGKQAKEKIHKLESGALPSHCDYALSSMNVSGLWKPPQYAPTVANGDSFSWRKVLIS
jgi:hypothetical protein